MNSLKISFTSQRNCFAGFPSSIVQSLDQTKVNIFELIGENGSCYTSWSGDKSNRSDTILMSGMFGSKLGLKDQQDVIVRIVSTYNTCKRAFLEPLSVDDWEILELNSSFIENDLLNQLRVIWSGMIFPVWVQNICIYCKIGKTEPPKTVLLMENMTELVITSKNRKLPPSIPYSTTQTPEQHASTNVERNLSSFNSDSTASASKYSEDTLSKQDVCTCPYVNKDGMDQNLDNESDRGLLGNIWHAWLNMQSWIFGETDSRGANSRNIQPIQEITDLQIDAVFRVQPMWKKFFDLGVEKLGITFQVCNQPTNVYVTHKSLRNMGIFSIQKQNHDTFIATVENIQSSIEEQEEAKNQAEQKKTKETNRYAQLDKDDNAQTKKMVVRVVVLDLESKECKWQFAISDGHLMMHDILRQQLALPVGAPVRLKAVTTKDTQIKEIHLQQIGTVPVSAGNDRIQTAFKTWVSCVSTIQCPLILGQKTIIKTLMYKEVYGTFIISFSENQDSSKNIVYGLLYPEHLDRIKIELSKQKCTPNHQYKTDAVVYKLADLSEIDTRKPKFYLEELDCLKLQAEKALEYVSVCVCQQPLSRNIFQHVPGLRNGSLLICGKRGTGKTVFTKAILFELIKWPIHAYITEINCKQLRGKRLEYIQKMLRNVFAEAAFRQPSVILMEDIDIIMAAPRGPEQEFTPEALYSLKAAELLKDEVRETVKKGHFIALLATCKETSAVNSLLVNPRGHHLFQQTIQIDPPDKITRQKILKTVMMSKANVSHDSITECDLDQVASATEGFVARDLDNIIERAVQAHRMHHKNQDQTVQPDVKLTQRDLDASLRGFTPISLRDVPLHSTGNTKWDDIGGLKEVRQTLIQMLQWPSKYPALFSNCPLRIRSGVLLYGAPGTGKTLIASAVAKECGLNFISIKGPELLSKYIGASEQAVRDTFVKAQSAKPCILFFDEFDSFAPRRGHDNTGVTDRVVNQLLTQLDGVESLEGVYVMAASSRPDLIDPALLRPGRLDRAIYCPIPDEADRLDILQVLARNVNLSADVDLKALSEQCVNFTGADFKALLYNAQLHAIHEIEATVAANGPNSLTGSPKIKTDWTFINGNHNSTEKQKSDNESFNREQAMVLEKKYVSQLTYIPDLKEGPVDLSQEKEQELFEHIPKVVENAEQEFYSNSLEVHQVHLHKAVQEVNPSVSESERQKYNKIYQTFVASRGGKFSDLTGNAGRKATLA